MDESMAVQLRELHQVIERQGARLAYLEEAVAGRTGWGGRDDRPEGQVAAAGSGDPGMRSPARTPTELDAPTDRRQLLTRAASAAAGAVIGGTAAAVAQASPAAAAAGVFDGDPAVTGMATVTFGGVGVYGYAQTGTGVVGETVDAIGVHGTATIGRGVRGTTTSGSGVEGRATSGIGVLAESLAGVQLALVGDPNPPTGSPVFGHAGSIVHDVNHDLWVCVTDGLPGTWRRVSGPSTAGALTVLTTPVRVYDSRSGFPPALGTKTPLDPGVARVCDLTVNGSGVPPGATAVMLSLVATGTTGVAGGFLSVYRNGIGWPGTSSLNWSAPGQNVAVTTVTAVDANARCSLYANLATHVVVDVLGYYR